jgi:two-component system NtrC family response regulator
MPQLKVLIVEDEEAVRSQLKTALHARYSLWFAESRVRALSLLQHVQPDVITVDLTLPPNPQTAEEGLRALDEILSAAPTKKVIAVTAEGDHASGAAAVELGALDYISKPIALPAYEGLLRRAVAGGEPGANGARGATSAPSPAFRGIIGSTPKMREIFEMVSLVAKTDASVLVQGESGTGKELIARAIHAASRRRLAPFVPINCGAIPDTLLEAELFGHEKGAYTGAHVQRKGKLELAESGTVFLDEVGEMSLPLQVMLLRFLQEREIERVGGRQRIRVDARIIAASNRDVKAEVTGGRLREDLYFRLSVVSITLPPLREREEDIVILANEFLRRKCQEYRRKLRFSAEALDAIAHYSWPGNVRELQNAVHRAVIMTRGRFVEPDDLGITPAEPTERLSLREARRRFERQLVIKALTRTRGNISRAAAELGISRPALHDLLSKYQIPNNSIRPTVRPLPVGLDNGANGASKSSVLAADPAGRVVHQITDVV